MPFLPPNQQRQSTEGNSHVWYMLTRNHTLSFTCHPHVYPLMEKSHSCLYLPATEHYHILASTFLLSQWLGLSGYICRWLSCSKRRWSPIQWTNQSNFVDVFDHCYAKPPTMSTAQYFRQTKLTDWARFYIPIDTKKGQFGDVLPSQSLGLVQKKIKPNKTNLICTKPKWSKLTWKHTKLQRKPLRKHTKTNKNLTKCKFKNCSHLCAYTCAQLLYTAPHEAHSSYDNIQPLPPDYQHSSDAIEEGVRQELWHLQ